MATTVFFCVGTTTHAAKPQGGSVKRSLAMDLNEDYKISDTPEAPAPPILLPITLLEVDDADAAYTAARSQSLDIVLDLRSEDCGQRHFSIKDPNGVHLDIVQAVEPTEEYRSDYGSE